MHYALAPGKVQIPNGWALLHFYEWLAYPEFDPDEGVNPYQPDTYRMVMITKL